MSHIDYISFIHDIPVILLHYYQLLEQLMQQRNTVALPLPCADDAISQSARREIYRDGHTDADLSDQSVKTDLCTIVKNKSYCVRWKLFYYGLNTPIFCIP